MDATEEKLEYLIDILAKIAKGDPEDVAFFQIMARESLSNIGERSYWDVDKNHRDKDAAQRLDDSLVM